MRVNWLKLKYFRMLHMISDIRNTQLNTFKQTAMKQFVSEDDKVQFSSNRVKWIPDKD